MARFGLKMITDHLPRIGRLTRSGLVHAVELLSSVKGLSVTRFTPQDVVRHPLVQRVIEAYEKEGQSA